MKFDSFYESIRIVMNSNKYRVLKYVYNKQIEKFGSVMKIL